MLTLNNDFVYREIFGVRLLFPVRRNNISNDVLSLNETAGSIFEECSQSRNSHDLAMLLCEKFIDVDKEKVYAELKAYTEKLISIGLLIER